MLNGSPAVQECDARDDAQGTKAGNKNTCHYNFS